MDRDVAGDPVKPAQLPGAQDARHVLLPVRKTAKGDLSYPVVLKYGGSMGPLSPLSDVPFPLVRNVRPYPSPAGRSVGIERSQVEIYVSKSQRWFSFGGSMHLAEDEADLQAGRVAAFNKEGERLIEATRDQDVSVRVRAANNLTKWVAEAEKGQPATGRAANKELQGQIDANSTTVTAANDALKSAGGKQQKDEGGEDNREALNDYYSKQVNVNGGVLQIGNNSYNGGTTVSGGTLVVTGGYTITGNGIAGGAVVLNPTDFNDNWIARNQLVAGNGGQQTATAGVSISVGGHDAAQSVLSARRRAVLPAWGAIRAQRGPRREHILRRDQRQRQPEQDRRWNGHAFRLKHLQRRNNHHQRCAFWRQHDRRHNRQQRRTGAARQRRQPLQRQRPRHQQWIAAIRQSQFGQWADRSRQRIVEFRSGEPKQSVRYNEKWNRRQHEQLAARRAGTIGGCQPLHAARRRRGMTGAQQAGMPQVPTLAPGSTTPQQPAGGHTVPRVGGKVRYDQQRELTEYQQKLSVAQNLDLPDAQSGEKQGDQNAQYNDDSKVFEHKGGGGAAGARRRNRLPRLPCTATRTLWLFRTTPGRR